MRMLIPMLALLFAAGVRAEPRDPSTYFFDQTLGDLGANLEEAREQGKQGIMIFFEQEECPFCHRMKTTVLNQPQVQEYFRKHFLIYKLDIEADNEIVDFEGNDSTEKEFFARVARNRGATPVIAFFDLQGKLVARYTGATSGVDEFMWLGEYASQGLYEKLTFTRYKREKRKQE